MLRIRQIWNGSKKLVNYIEECKPKKICLVFGHGLGDTCMFLTVFDKLASLYPDIEFTLALQKGLGFEELEQDIVSALYRFAGNKKVIYSGDLSYNDPNLPYDIIADIDFPMTEGHTNYTKGEGCCKNELGIELTAGHKELTCGKNRLVAVHFNITCLPDSCNPNRDTAEKIWDDILSAGFIPIESHFQHVFHNPVNQKFDFVDCTVRRVQPRISTLVGLLESCCAFVGVVSGNLHTALSVMPHDRIFFLDKDFHLASFVKDSDKIAQANLRAYKGEVKLWLENLKI